MNKLKEKIEKGGIDSVKASHRAQYLQPFPLKVAINIEEDAEEGILSAETYGGRSTWIYSIMHLLQNTRRILHTHKWSIVKPAKGYYWPTSDNPVVKVNYYSHGDYDLKGGWGVQKGNILFPIGPEHAMFVQIGDRPILKGTRLPENVTRELVEIIVKNAHRMVFSNKENDDIPIIRKRIVDKQKIERENEEWRQWHVNNSMMEREYLASNKKS